MSAGLRAEDSILSANLTRSATNANEKQYSKLIQQLDEASGNKKEFDGDTMDFSNYYDDDEDEQD